MNADVRGELTSLIVIAYNEEKRIVECVSSILAQEYRGEYEVIVVDDGSVDHTVAVLRARFPGESRLRIVELGVNQGRGAARDAGIQAALGGTVGFVDADIVLPLDWLHLLSSELEGRSAVSGIAVPDGDCAVLWRIFKPEARVKAGSEQITGNNVLFVGDVIRANGFDRSSKLGEDFRLASRLRSEGHVLATIGSVSVEHREAKSYRKAVRWLFESGVDASRLLVEFSRVRMPDLSWFGWAVASSMGGALLAAGAISVGSAALGEFLLISVVAAGHCWSRFDPRKHPGRWLAACVANIPLIAAYLIGRSVGVLVVGYERMTGRKR